MKRWFLVGLWLAGGSAACAQPSMGTRQDFKLSQLVLTSGDTLAGPLSMRTAPDMVYVTQPDGSVRPYVAAQVVAFAVQGQVAVPQRNRRTAATYDPSTIRLFRTLTWQSERMDLRPEPTFFEQISEGPVLLLRRQSTVRVLGGMHDTAPVPVLTPSGGRTPPQNPMPAAQRSVSYLAKQEFWDNFYLAWPTGEIRPLRNNKKDLLEAFPQQAKQLQVFAKAQGIGYSTAAELRELVNYANSLASTSSR
ncbi:hypothetical protein [Hymenobacter arizonensis]|uniref:Uncharacterized protein n=1 Tax=Hymenobacter arizonensis TaxID=1227077 RepID=A0A1I5UA19_HYMAR|nr:hypothetical protein [Hymenobacter arizonensis]SFP92133.1 hypothetical protein SAMN04515668_0833 [Hymenobacter arizonensis]